MALINEYEKLCWPKGELLMGIDEAGRGPLCGPLVVACAVLPADYVNEEINDSKKLSGKKRERLFKVIVKDALYYDFRIVSPGEIDELNIYAATRKAMAELAKTYEVRYVLTDAMKIEEDPRVIPMIKGDAKSVSIAAASILAKVLRDSIM
ncbi:MAG: ribonuclease HII, partial [Erysipelotrichaceae bacterium]|nr:ribonuclease HII [Erysipelotrichaceae bacterium]